MGKYKVGVISLGCDKNRIDSEIMLGTINSNYTITNDASDADIIIINTCGFIEKAKQESIDTILEMAEYKTKGKCKLLMATGCLTQRYGEELANLIPEIDVMLGVNDYLQINNYINDFINNNKKIIQCNYSDAGINEGKRVLTTKSSTAYIRIAEGCDNHCTYCIIPKIRGHYRSRSIESVLEEANSLVEQGVTEIILIAQDTTRFGIDIYGEKYLHILIRKLSSITDLKWIRVLYCYPEEIYPELIEELATNEKFCRYLDLPIQHISNKILKLMGRKTSKESIINIINQLRSSIPDISLRTSIIVGFPGETEEDFMELVEFVKDTAFDNLGVFKYSQEEGSAAAILPNQVDERIKTMRERQLMKEQKQLIPEINAKNINNTYNVLVEEELEEYYIGRSEKMAPEIDGVIYIKKTSPIKVGSFIKVRIEKSIDYDLLGVVINEFSK